MITISASFVIYSASKTKENETDNLEKELETFYETFDQILIDHSQENRTSCELLHYLCVANELFGSKTLCIHF